MTYEERDKIYGKAKPVKNPIPQKGAGNEKCEGCTLYTDGFCKKMHKNGACRPSTREWLVRDEHDEPMKFIPVDRMCRFGSIFGNEYIGLTQDDIDRLKNGEVIYIGGEYGTFIGFLEDRNDNS